MVCLQQLPERARKTQTVITRSTGPRPSWVSGNLTILRNSARPRACLQGGPGPHSWPMGLGTHQPISHCTNWSLLHPPPHQSQPEVAARTKQQQ